MKLFKNLIRLYKFRDTAYRKGFNAAKKEYLKKLEKCQNRHRQDLIIIREQEKAYWKNQIYARDMEIMRLRNSMEDNKRLITELYDKQTQFEFTVNEVVNYINQSFDYMAKSIQCAKIAQSKIEFHNVKENKKVLNLFSKMISEK